MVTETMIALCRPRRASFCASSFEAGRGSRAPSLTQVHDVFDFHVVDGAPVVLRGVGPS